MINPNRHSSRLQNYDYSAPGWYFVTICTQNRICLFGEIVNQKMVLNNAGQIINEWWSKIPERFANVALDQFQIMPNHIHGIIQIVGAIPCNRPVDPAIPCNRPSTVSPNHSGENVVSPLQQRERRQRGKQRIPNTYNGLGRYISWFKRMTTNEYIRNVKQHNLPPFAGKIFQRNYYERIIRNKNELNRIRQYIKLNPQTWERDKNNLVQNSQS